MGGHPPYIRPVLTLYSPVNGHVATHPDGQGLAIVAGIGRKEVRSPTRGTVTSAENNRVTITDLRDRVVELRIEASPGSVTTIVAEGDTLGFDQPVFSWDGTGSLLVLISSPGATDVMPHAQPGDEVAAGADLFSVGPFACGA